jgi:hypothetical protein
MRALLNCWYEGSKRGHNPSNSTRDVAVRFNCSHNIFVPIPVCGAHKQIFRISPRQLGLYDLEDTMSRMRDEEEELDESFQHADIPNTFRELRACMTCSLIKTFTQFYDTGCENCAFLQMADNRQRVAECTSAYFEGCVASL